MPKKKADIGDDEELETAAEIEARIEDIQARINEGLEGERTWSTAQIAEMRQELADLKAQSTDTIPALVTQIQELREQLTLLSPATPATDLPEPVTISHPSLQTPPISPQASPVNEPDAPRDQRTANNRQRGKNLL